MQEIRPDKTAARLRRFAKSCWQNNNSCDRGAHKRNFRVFSRCQICPPVTLPAFRRWKRRCCAPSLAWLAHKHAAAPARNEMGCQILNGPGGQTATFQTASENFEPARMVFSGLLSIRARRRRSDTGWRTVPISGHLSPIRKRQEPVGPQEAEPKKSRSSRAMGGWGERRAVLHETFRGMNSGAASRTIRSLSVALPVHRNTH